MNPKWENLYNDLQADLARCLALEHPEKDNAESCFWIARNYWEQLQVSIHKFGFCSQAEEIEFYKRVKPTFARFIEYYSLLSEGLQFEPAKVQYPADFAGRVSEEDWVKAWQSSVQDYWKAEEKRGDRFYSKNQVLLDYCASDRNEYDHDYFLSGKDRLPVDVSHRRSHNRDTDLFTVYEEILTTWQAYELYHNYIKKKIHEPVGG